MDNIVQDELIYAIDNGDSPRLIKIKEDHLKSVLETRYNVALKQPVANKNDYINQVSPDIEYEVKDFDSSATIDRIELESRRINVKDSMLDSFKKEMSLVINNNVEVEDNNIIQESTNNNEKVVNQSNENITDSITQETSFYKGDSNPSIVEVNTHGIDGTEESNKTQNAVLEYYKVKQLNKDKQLELDQSKENLKVANQELDTMKTEYKTLEEQVAETKANFSKLEEQVRQILAAHQNDKEQEIISKEQEIKFNNTEINKAISDTNDTRKQMLELSKEKAKYDSASQYIQNELNNYIEEEEKVKIA